MIVSTRGRCRWHLFRFEKAPCLALLLPDGKGPPQSGRRLAPKRRLLPFLADIFPLSSPCPVQNEAPCLAPLLLGANGPARSGRRLAPKRRLLPLWPIFPLLLRHVQCRAKLLRSEAGISRWAAAEQDAKLRSALAMAKKEGEISAKKAADAASELADVRSETHRSRQAAAEQDTELRSALDMAKEEGEVSTQKAADVASELADVRSEADLSRSGSSKARKLRVLLRCCLTGTVRLGADVG